jgi:hypothetical protein
VQLGPSAKPQKAVFFEDGTIFTSTSEKSPAGAVALGDKRKWVVARAQWASKGMPPTMDKWSIVDSYSNDVVPGAAWGNLPPLPTFDRIVRAAF